MGWTFLIDPEPGGAGAPPERRQPHRNPTAAERYLDPANCVIRAAGVSTADGEERLDGDESGILTALDRRFAELPTGVISTWHGSILGLPFLRTRAAVHGLRLGLRLVSDDQRGSHPSMANDARQVRLEGQFFGAARPVCGRWHEQSHLDLGRVYRDRGPVPSRRDGAGRVDPLAGAHLARSLTERRWNRAHRHVDRLPQPLASAADSLFHLTPVTHDEGLAAAAATPRPHRSAISS